MVVSFALLVLLQASRPLLAATVSMLVSLVAALVITIVGKWKISLYMIGIAGANTLFVLLFGPFFLSLTPLVLLIGWARWKVRVHTACRTVCGVVLATEKTLVVFSLFRLL